MRSHFHGSLRRSSQTVTSPQQQPTSSFTTLPASTYSTQPSVTTSPDGNPAFKFPSTGPSDVVLSSVTGSVTVGAATTSFKAEPVSQPSEITICCLCEKIADMQLVPCNHVVLCSEHASSAKKCPECRVS